MILSIKNMVCPRCIEAVQQITTELAIPAKEIRLGSVILSDLITDERKKDLAKALKIRGFELLEDQRSKTIENVKKLIIQQVFSDDISQAKISIAALLKGNIPYEYSSISKLFSSVEGITLEKYAIKQKIERAKELLVYEQLGLEQIADKLGFSSGAYLSTLFKKELGMTPTAFKSLRDPTTHKKPIDQV